MAGAYDHFDFIVVERKLVGFFFGFDDAIGCIDIQVLRVRRETTLTYDPDRTVHREAQVRLRRLDTVVLQLRLGGAFGLPREHAVAVWRIRRDFV